MDTLLVLLSGFVIGMRHALESDHLAAVAALATQARDARHTLRLGVNWGVGHTLVLLLAGSAVLWLDAIVPERFASALEFVVGLMLMLLGADVIRRMRRRRIHFHVHEHGDGVRHFHAHAHDGTLPHEEDPHDHAHPGPASLLQPRALLVGMVHGMAGTAALTLLTLQTLHDPWLGMLYIALFGAGSIMGMGVVSAIIALPLRRAGRGLARWHASLQYAIGLFTLGYGLYIAWHLAPRVFAAG